jgi:HlyD family secretion protein
MTPSPASRWLLRALVVLAVAAAAGLAWKATRPAPVAVLAAAVETGRVENTVANTRAGSVSACRRAKLATPLGGRIDKLTVREGDRVKQGQLLLELWNDDLVARERVSLEQLKTARTREKEACVLADIATRAAARTRQLRDKGFVSEDNVDRAESEAKAKRAVCESARTQVEEAQARISASRADTARTVMRAPFDGIVAEVNGEVGEFLTPSPPGIPTLPAIDLIDDSCLYVSAPIDEVDAAQLKVGMPARITLDAYRGRHFAGRLRRIAPYVLALEKQARTAEVEVDFDAPAEARHLLVGYSADVEVVVAAHDGVLRIPTAALMPGNRVLVLAPGGVLEERRVETGLSNWQYTEIRSGLGQGERVVTSLERAGVKAGARATEEAKADANRASAPAK